MACTRSAMSREAYIEHWDYAFLWIRTHHENIHRLSENIPTFIGVSFHSPPNMMLWKLQAIYHQDKKFHTTMMENTYRIASKESKPAPTTT